MININRVKMYKLVQKQNYSNADDDYDLKAVLRQSEVKR